MRRTGLRRLAGAAGASLLTLAWGASAQAATAPVLQLPQIRGGIATPLEILLALTALSFAPAVLVLLTSFTRIVIVLSFLRTALGTPTIPPNQVVIGLAFFLTVLVMAPTFQRIDQTAIAPFLAGHLSQSEVLARGMAPLRGFMLRQVDAQDVATMMNLAHLPQPSRPAAIPTYVLIPAFVVHELKVAFEMAFLLFLPFLLIDLVVSSTLMSMGMLMLPPTLVSLPFKILLFLLVGGWDLVVRSLVLSFH
jgi:flagellar biosynthetic protein FliP